MFKRVMRELYEAASLHEAQLLVDRLQERGIRTYIRNAQLQGSLGELPFSVRPVVCITEPIRWPHAIRVLAEFEQARLANPGPPLQCTHCGEASPSNFELCWKCREPLDAQPVRSE